jgi:hypothetical protein
VEQPLLGPLPSLRLELGVRPVTRKVDRLSCVRFGSARYSVPCCRGTTSRVGLGTTSRVGLGRVIMSWVHLRR